MKLITRSGIKLQIPVNPVPLREISLSAAESPEGMSRVAQYLWSNHEVALGHRVFSPSAILCDERGVPNATLCLIRDNGEPKLSQIRGFAYYPRPEHTVHYLQAHSVSRGGGPGYQAPGCVGLIEVMIFETPNGKEGEVSFLQGSVNFKELRTQSPTDGLALTKISRRYGGWRLALSEYAVRYFKSVGCQRVLVDRYMPGSSAESLGTKLAEAGFQQTDEYAFERRVFSIPPTMPKFTFDF